MKPMRSTTFQGDDKESRSTRSEDTYSDLRSRTEEKKQRRRREWQRQQERERQHEKLKRQKILEYERKRAQVLKYAEEKSSRHSRSKSGSESPSHLRYRHRSTSTASKSGSLHEKLDRPTSGTVSSLFRGPENTQINTMELRRIKVDIHRNIPIEGPVTELQRDILDPEDVTMCVKRREESSWKIPVFWNLHLEEREGCKPIFDREEIKNATIKTNKVGERRTVVAIDKEQSGEGCKPIFDREEIKKATIKTNEVEERRTVVATDKEQSASKNKSRTTRRRSLSLSPIRNHIYSSGCPPSYQSRSSSLEKRREYKEKYTERDANKHDTNRSRSRELQNSYSRPFVEEKSYRDRYRDRSNERSHERRDKDRDGDRDRDRDRDRNKDRDRSRKRRDLAPHYIESPIPLPFYGNYYGSFPPRPIVVSPMLPLRGQIPPMGRGRHPALMAPVRPFPPRFPPDMYRLGHPPPNLSITMRMSRMFISTGSKMTSELGQNIT